MNQNESNPIHEDETLDRALRDVGTLGKVWAHYGLLAGRNALATSALTLKKVAGLLDHLATALEDDTNAEAQTANTIDEVPSPSSTPSP